MSRSRLEINFMRLLDETQQMANGSKAKDWTFEKVRVAPSLPVLLIACIVARQVQECCGLVTWLLLVPVALVMGLDLMFSL